MEYRLYAPADFAALYAIEEICFQPPFRFSRTYMQRLVRSNSATTSIAEEDGAMAGFAIVELSAQSDGAVAYIVTIEVLPSFRRRGVGGELLGRLEDAARAATAMALWLHVDAENAGAMALYEEHGYRCIGREENFYAARRPALVYRKLLKPDAHAA